ncbi:MAG: penicillin-binding protein 2 [Coriobacteriales bacterium]|nr:penicillin-binding protein 2 [Coriobacteriales bacterium]
MQRENRGGKAGTPRRGAGTGRFGFAASEAGLSRVFAVALALFFLVVVRLVFLQVVDGPSLASRAEARRTNVQVLQAKRGTIYDRKGNILAMSEECYDVYCNPKEVTDVEEEAKLLVKWLGGDEAGYKELLSTDSTFVYVKRRADKEACESLRGDLIANGRAGVYLLSQTRRVYPYGKVAGQLIGLVSENDQGEYEGITGLELMYNSELSGKDGEMIMETGAHGVPIAGAASQVTEPIDGEDIVISIDVDVQKYAEECIEEATAEYSASSGMCMACDPRTGEILAACSTPYADISQPDTLTNEALNLKLVSSAYDPGSIFKVLTAAIGVDSGKVSTTRYFDVPPTIVVGSDLVMDEDGRNKTESMNLREMLRRSSNVGSALIAQEGIGAQTFSEGVESFGIGSLTGVDFPGETAGMVKPLEQYDGSSLGSMSFGQGLTIPMVQMVRAVSSIANGGTLPTPHFALTVGDKQLEWEQGPRSVSGDTARKVADMMVTVVKDGTGFSAAVDGYEVAAKTGTGEQAKNGVYMQGKYLASLIGFAPAKDPEVLLYVGLNETPYISYSSAGPVFSAIMGEVLKDMGVLSNPQGS